MENIYEKDVIVVNDKNFYSNVMKNDLNIVMLFYKNKHKES